VKTKTLFIFGNGHGGINPETSRYVTAGKRSPKLNGKCLLEEGVNNRDNVKRIVTGMKAAGMDAINLFDTWVDVPLRERTRRINELCRTRKCVFISIHSDGAGNGVDWYEASGIGTFKYTKCSKNSSLLAKYIHQELICNFHGIAKDRKIRSKNFHVLRATNCPAILLELGFHTDLSETKLMLGEDWKNRAVKAIVDGCSIYESNN
jgi:N-acetylmuramoyl-L-alanine amidase